MNYEELKPFAASDRQRELLDLLISEPSLSVYAAGKQLGMHKTHAYRSMRRLRAAAERASDVRTDLYCPRCAAEGLTEEAERAESGRMRYKCGACGLITVRPAKVRPQILADAPVKKCERFLITSAVNDTPIVSGAHKTFRALARRVDAQYIIVPGVYKNPDLMHQGVIHGYTWPDEIHPYVCKTDVALNANLMLQGSVRIAYTAINPLAGMNHAGNVRSEIYAHPQVAMEMVATAKPMLPKMMHTTGTISEPNYGDSRQARKAAFHHSLSALLVEVEGDRFWTTEVHYDGVGAQLFDQYHTPDACVTRPTAGIVYGDIHARYLLEATHRNIHTLSTRLSGGYNVFHDVHDQHNGSHHTFGNTLFQLQANAAREFSIRDELLLTARFLADKPNPAVVESNHHHHLIQWFNRFKPALDPVNVDLYFELGEMARVDIAQGGDGNLLRLFLDCYCSNPDIRYVSCDEQFSIAGIDCSQHGDRGLSGTRGSAPGFAKSGHKTMVGHSHTPRIEKGCYQVGTSATGMPYARGFSSWFITHGLIYPSGKRALVSEIDGDLSPLLRETLGL